MITEANGFPLAITLTGANSHDVTQLLPLLDAIPAIKGKPGRPLQHPKEIYGDRAYFCKTRVQKIIERGIVPRIPKRNAKHGSGLGKNRWVVERFFAWLHVFRRLRVRFERRSDIHEGFLSLACAMICWNGHENSFC